MPIITRESYNVEKSDRLPSWMEEFASNLAKTSVESKTKADKSIYDQISSIMGNNKPKYPTVAAAVEDMKERSGMSEFLNKLRSEGQNESGNNKQANCKCGKPEHHKNKEVQLFEAVPQLKDTVDNYIEDTNGNLPIPAIIEKIKSIHRNDVVEDSDWDDDQFLNYINDKSIDVKKLHPSQDMQYRNLGKTPHYKDEEIDPSNSDALYSLTPAVIAK